MFFSLVAFLSMIWHWRCLETYHKSHKVFSNLDNEVEACALCDVPTFLCCLINHFVTLKIVYMRSSCALHATNSWIQCICDLINFFASLSRLPFWRPNIKYSVLCGTLWKKSSDPALQQILILTHCRSVWLLSPWHWRSILLVWYLCWKSYSVLNSLSQEHWLFVGNFCHD